MIETPPGAGAPMVGAGAPSARGRAAVPTWHAGYDTPAVPVPPARRRRRPVLLGALLAVLVLAGAAAVVLVVRPGPVRGWLADAAASPAPPSAAPEPAPPPVLTAAGSNAPVPTAAGIRAAIGPLVKARALGSRVNISVVDVASGDTLYTARPDELTTPASTTKLVTAAAVLAARGPAYRIDTRVVAGARPGEVVLVGGGDPTLSVTANDLFPGAARLDRLAAQVRKALGGAKPTRVVIDGSLFTGSEIGPGWDPADITAGQTARVTALTVYGGRREPVHHEVGGDPRFPRPDLAAAAAFARALGLRASAVSRGRAPADPVGDEATGGDSTGGEPGTAASGETPGAGAPRPGTELGRVSSPPLIRLVEWMLQLSDNVLAEALARQVALAADQPATFAGAAAAIEAKVAELGLPAGESDLVDASGLSRRNRITPSFLTDLLSLAASGQQPRLAGMFGGLPVAGWSGTLAQRFLSPAPNRVGQGLVRAKTGTLNGVNAIAGELVTADGRLLVFAVMADRVPPDLAAVRAALDRIAVALVSCGCR